MNEFKDFLINWNIMCIKPIGNSITLSPLDKHWINEIKNNLSEFITESDNYYTIHYHGNIINIQK